MEISEELYTIIRSDNYSLNIKEFDNFEDAYTYFKKDLDQYLKGRIVHTYKVAEEFYYFDKTKEIPRDQIMDMIENT